MTETSYLEIAKYWIICVWIVREPWPKDVGVHDVLVDEPLCDCEKQVDGCKIVGIVCDCRRA